MNGDADRTSDDFPLLISALDLIMQHHAANVGVRFGRNRYFFNSLGPQRLSLGLEAWRGFFVSVRPMYKQLMVNVNVCMSAFYIPGNLADAMTAFQSQTSGGMPAAFVDKLKVATTYLGYTKKKAILRITGETPRQAKFDCEELGGTVTVEEYFRRSEYLLHHLCTHDCS